MGQTWQKNTNMSKMSTDDMKASSIVVFSLSKRWGTFNVSIHRGLFSRSHLGDWESLQTSMLLSPGITCLPREHYTVWSWRKMKCIFLPLPPPRKERVRWYLWLFGWLLLVWGYSKQRFIREETLVGGEGLGGEGDEPLAYATRAVHLENEKRGLSQHTRCCLPIILLITCNIVAGDLCQAESDWCVFWWDITSAGWMDQTTKHTNY